MIPESILYNNMYSFDPWRTDRASQKLRRIIYLRNLKKFFGKRIYFNNALDIGCGEGILSKKLSVLSDTMTLVDYSNTILALCKNNTDNKFTYVQNTLPEVKVEGHFDIVYAIEVLYYLNSNELRAFFKNVQGNIKTNSFLIITLNLNRFISLETDFEVVKFFWRYLLFLNVPEVFYYLEKLCDSVYLYSPLFNKNIAHNEDSSKIGLFVQKYAKLSIAIFILLYPIKHLFRMLYKSTILAWLFYYIGCVFNIKHNRDLIIIRLKKDLN